MMNRQEVADNLTADFSVRDTVALKGAAVILMFYHHLFGCPDRLAEGITYQPLFEIMGETSAGVLGAVGKICVAIFVFLGGYGTYISAVRSEDMSKFILRRCKNMYLSLWKVFLVFIPVCMLFDVPRVTKDIKVFLLNFIGLDTVYNREWWFFAPYVVLILLFPLIKALADRSRNVYIGLFLVAVSAVIPNYVFPLLSENGRLSNFETSLIYVLVENFFVLLPGFFGGCVFAKYDVLSKLKEKFRGKYSYGFIALLCIPLIVLVRGMIGADYDYILVMLFVPAVTVALNNKIGIYIHNFLNIIGKESTNMWLIHSFYCYYILQDIVYAPYYTPLIALWLLVMTFASSKLLNLFWKGLGTAGNKICGLIKNKTA